MAAAGAAEAEVVQLYDGLWTVHISSKDDEWTGLCGANSDDIVLVDVPERSMQGYTLCAGCRQNLDSDEG